MLLITYTSYTKQYETCYPFETINVTLALQKENYTSTDTSVYLKWGAAKWDSSANFVCYSLFRFKTKVEMFVFVDLSAFQEEFLNN